MSCVRRRGGQVVVSLLLALLSCLSLLPSAMAQREPQTPEGMYDQALKWMQRGYYERAIEGFEKLKTRYPFSQYALQAELRVGDTHFLRGEYALAVDAYQTFIKLHPSNAELDYVMYRIAESEFEQAPEFAQRDQAPTRRMLSSIQLFEQRFPESQYTKDVQSMRRAGRTRLAKGLFGIGQYYYRRARFEYDREYREKLFVAAMRRFEEVLDQFPDVEEFSGQALYLIGHIYVMEGEKADAITTLERLVKRYPASRYIRRLEAGIARMRSPKSVPPPVPVEAGAVSPADPPEAPASPSE